MSQWQINQDDLTNPEVLALLKLHLDEMHQWSPAESVHAMPPERLREEDVSFYSVWNGGVLAAVGALKHLDANRGEIKSMRAAPQARGSGAGQRLLIHLIEEAKRRGYTWLGLETGRPEPFRAAIGLYRKHGFVECKPFDNYVDDGFSVCMERNL